MHRIRGNKTLIETLFGAIKSSKPAGCYIIEGMDGSGKTEIARLAAAYLCCESPKNDNPCLECKNCKNILSGCHIDVTELAPPEEGKKITIDAIRELIRKSYVVPSEANYRVFIIKHSEEMRKEAQNALLKSIEEPSPNTVYFLLTNDKSRLLPTVRSRAVKLSTEILSNDEIIGILKENDISIDQKKLPPKLLSVGNAMKLLNDASYPEKAATIEKYFAEILHGASFSSLCSVISPNSVKRPEFKDYLSMIKAASRDILIRSHNKDSSPDFFSDLKLLSDIASVASAKRIISLFDFCDEMLIANESNINIFSAISQLHLISKGII